MRHWFSTRGAIPDAKQSAAQRAGTDAVGAEEAAAAPTGSSALEPQPGGGTEEKMEQSVCGAEADADSSATGNPGLYGLFVWGGFYECVCVKQI